MPFRIPFAGPADFLVRKSLPPNEKTDHRLRFGSSSWNRPFTAPLRPPLPVFLAMAVIVLAVSRNQLYGEGVIGGTESRSAANFRRGQFQIVGST